jgi:hypothetical protein
MNSAPSSNTGTLSRVWILGFAGHRNLTDPAATSAAIRSAVDGFRSRVEGIVVGRASAADGADLLFLEACRAAGLACSVVLPFPEERFREDFADDDRWARAKELIDAAASVEIAPGHEKAPEAYHLASREIIDVADAMLFVWDGMPARGIGGTAETVADARERGMPFQIIDAVNSGTGPFENAPQWPWKDATFESLPPAQDVAGLFEALDQRASKGAPKTRMLSATSISLNQIAVLIAGVLLACGLAEGVADGVKFVLVTLAGVLPWISKRKRLSQRWHDDRVRAELLRSMLATHAFSPPLRPFAAELFLADAPLLRSAAWRLAGNARPWADEQAAYLTGRLDGQIGYLESKGGRAAKRHARLKLAFKISSIGAMILSAAASFDLLARFAGKPWIGPLMTGILPALLPATAAWCLAMIALFEYKRRSSLYRQMVDRLRAKRVALANAKCRVTAADVIASCERLLLTELWEWGESSGKRR